MTMMELSVAFINEQFQHSNTLFIVFGHFITKLRFNSTEYCEHFNLCYYIYRYDHVISVFM